MSTSSKNPVTGETQRVALSTDEEIILGLQARPAMARQFGGLDPDAGARERIDSIGKKLTSVGFARSTPYKFDFHLLADPQTVNAFALPGGQIFITRALYDQLKTEDQLAGVLAHEIGHVVERHSAEQMAKAQLTSGLTTAAVVATYDQDSGASRGAAMAALVGQLVTMKFGRADELESDEWGVRLTSKAGYDPRAMIDVMEILARAAGTNRPPEFLSTHPTSENRIARIREAIARNSPEQVSDSASW